jgi:hypothetical protein
VAVAIGEEYNRVLSAIISAFVGMGDAARGIGGFEFRISIT